MTSIIHPAVYASQLATKAQEELSSASSSLFQAPPRPMHPTPTIGIPERSGPDTPDNPWFVGNRPNPPMPIRTPFQQATIHARNAVEIIGNALTLGASDQLSRDVLNAFGRAKQQAEVGLRELTAKTMVPLNPSRVKLNFDGAGLWLDLARNLIDLELGRTPAPVAPGEPGSPITIKPLEPVIIQLPSPDSEIQ
jgi:hypothetical protein